MELRTIHMLKACRNTGISGNSVLVHGEESSQIASCHVLHKCSYNSAIKYICRITTDPQGCFPVKRFSYTCVHARKSLNPFNNKGIPNGFPCRIARSMHEGCRETQVSFPKVEQHPKCMDHAILLGKPFGNCFIK